MSARRRVAGALALAVLVAAGACRPPAAEPGPDLAARARRLGVVDTGVKILLVGIDGATFDVLAPLAAAGELPALARLVESGASGRLLSERPMRSPALWTTISTGYSRERHGIRHFVVEDAGGGPPVLVHSTLRRELQLWDILGAAGRSVGVLGGWASGPAEPVRGWLVSDRMIRSRWSEWSDGVQERWATFPPELAGELAELVVAPESVGRDRVAEIVELDDAEAAELAAAAKPLRAHALSVLKFAWANQLSHEAMAERLLARGQPDFAAIFLIATDPISHTFWHWFEPAAFGVAADERARRLGEAIPNVYRHNDRFLAEILAGVDLADTVVLVVSDHGFKPSGTLPGSASERQVERAFDDAFAGEDDGVTVGQSGKHHLDGVLIAAGGPIRSARVEGATLYDLAPTILALSGFPVPEAMPGRVLTEMIDPVFLERFPVARVPNYGALVRREALRVDSAAGPDEEQLDMLRSLGYIN